MKVRSQSSSIPKKHFSGEHAMIVMAEKIRQQDSRAARWIAADALRELKIEAVQARLRREEA